MTNQQVPCEYCASVHSLGFQCAQAAKKIIQEAMDALSQISSQPPWLKGQVAQMPEIIHHSGCSKNHLLSEDCDDLKYWSDYEDND